MEPVPLNETLGVPVASIVITIGFAVGYESKLAGNEPLLKDGHFFTHVLLDRSSEVGL